METGKSFFPGLKGEAELRALFGIEPGEALVEDFACALSSRILLQGRLYLFSEHACFYSNIFGYETNIKIPFRDITAIKKAKLSYVFPNAIEVHAFGKKRLFASFLFRHEAYNSLTTLWCKNSNYARLYLGDHAPVDNGGSADSEELLLEDDPEAEIEANSIAADPDSNVLAAPPPTPMPVPPTPEAPTPRSYLMSPGSSGGSGDVGQAIGDAVRKGIKALSFNRVATPVAAVNGVAEDARALGTKSLAPGMEHPPPPSAKMEEIVSTELPVSVETFFEQFLADKCGFTEEWRVTRGDSDIRTTPWTQEVLGHGWAVREVTFRSPVKASFGPRSTMVHETQRHHAFGSATPQVHLVLESSQVLQDIPFGDHFSVETRVDVSPLPPAPGGGKTARCLLKVYLEVVFSKKTMWRPKIESGVKSGTVESYESMVMYIKKKLDAGTKRPRVTGNQEVDLNRIASMLENENVPVDYAQKIRAMLNLPPEHADTNSFQRQAAASSRSGGGGIVSILISGITGTLSSAFSHVPLTAGLVLLLAFLLCQWYLLSSFTRVQADFNALRGDVANLAKALAHRAAAQADDTCSNDAGGSCQQ
eukprot:jgi/Chlat1/4743/Chrsp308S00816